MKPAPYPLIGHEYAPWWLAGTPHPWTRVKVLNISEGWAQLQPLAGTAEQPWPAWEWIPVHHFYVLRPVE